MNRLILSLLMSPLAAPAGEPAVTPAAQLIKLWKETKSLSAPEPVEKLRKGLDVEVGVAATPRAVEVKVDANSAASFLNVQFELGSATLMGGTTTEQLTEIAKAMTAAGTRRFLIEGHTCDLGSDDSNFNLSRARALAVRSFLGGQGIDPARLQVLGVGESDPSVANVDEAARAQNRRVQIFLKL